MNLDTDPPRVAAWIARYGRHPRVLRWLARHPPPAAWRAAPAAWAFTEMSFAPGWWRA